MVYAIMNSVENFCFDKEAGYFNFLVFYGLFSKINRKHFPRVPKRYRNTRGSLGELEITWKHSPNGKILANIGRRSPRFILSRVKHSPVSRCLKSDKSLLALVF